MLHFLLPSARNKKIFPYYILLACFFLFQTSYIYGVPAYPEPVEFEQPDGQRITIIMKGDEKINWAETPDGYTILVTKDGWYEYAVKDEHGDLGFSGIRVSPLDRRQERELQLLADTPKGLFFSKRQVEAKKSIWEVRDAYPSRSFPTTGEQTLLCILMGYQDLAFTKTQDDFDALFNQLNYTVDGATGSVRDYYLENSYGQFDLTVDVVGPYSAENDMEHYGSTWAGARDLVEEAVQLANPDVNYADYDNSGNGWVDGIYVIFAGYGEEAGGGPDAIWSHAWNIDPVELDGTMISRYACSPELRGNSGSNITRIGVIGHEFGHVLGAPDYYDTDGSDSGGQFSGTGSWDMMAGGTWNNGGATPAHHNPYTKIYMYDWAEPTLLFQPDHISLDNAAENNHSFYRINTNTPGEYYLLENRQQIHFDSHIPGEGLLIYHAHKEVALVGNAINVGHPQKLYPVSAGAHTDPQGTPASYGNINSAQTPFPGTTDQTNFTDYSTPSAISWQGANTHKPLTNISLNQNDSTVTFDFMENTDHIADWFFLDDGNHSGSIGLNDGGVYQIAARYEPADLEPYTNFVVNKVRVYVNDVPSNAAIKIWKGEDQESLQEVAHKNFTPGASSWIIVELEETVVIDTNKELWIGAEYDDPGTGVYTGSRDIQTDHDGRGNMIRTDTTDHAEWVPLSNYEIDGDWNIQAHAITADLNVVHFDVINNNGMIRAKADSVSIQSGEAVIDGRDILFTATPDTGFQIKEWIKDGETVEGHHATTFELPDIQESVQVNVAFQGIYHTVDFAVEGDGGELIAESGQEAIQPGGDIQEGSDILFTAIPDTGFQIYEWRKNGSVIEEFTDDDFYINDLNEDVMVTIAFQNVMNVFEPSAGQVQVFPNPTAGKVTIKADQDIKETRLLDINGQIIKISKHNSPRQEMNLQDINNGFYILQVHLKDRVAHQRIQLIN